jgi:hypothetical protein
VNQCFAKYQLVIDAVLKCEWCWFSDGLLMLLRLEFEEPDVFQSCCSRDIAENTVWPSFVVHCVESRLVLPVSADGASSFLRYNAHTRSFCFFLLDRSLNFLGLGLL